ncbi:hypothetical protein GCM10010218_47310 [Streptomyces mashuensis]|uniref:Uncharacterized protein n=1 Tax=Streptomyces mashuensis TaxID=33904 RepID=A0A919EEU7_9ACTN|nr:hypothetical protein GCM10010218_47310 [Streptomyces mashuensis]
MSGAEREELRSRVAEANARSRRGRGHPELVPVPPGGLRCAGCWEIKQRRYGALERGDQVEAVRMAEAMGFHLRYAHPG